jgi:hypothetical protein
MRSRSPLLSRTHAIWRRHASADPSDDAPSPAPANDELDARLDDELAWLDEH